MYEDIIRDIRTHCRMAMNGVTSTSMRTHGLDYKLNFGVSLMQLKDLAKRYEANAELAELLWKDGTRELKILGTMLYPVAELSDEVVDRWIAEVPNQEIREQLCFNLLQFYPQAMALGEKYVSDADVSVRTSGYYLLARCVLAQKKLVDLNLPCFSLVWEDVVSDNVSLRNGAKLLLQNAGRVSKEIADQILLKLVSYKDSEDLIKKEVYDSLSFEFDYSHG